MQFTAAAKYHALDRLCNIINVVRITDPTDFYHVTLQEAIRPIAISYNNDDDDYNNNNNNNNNNDKNINNNNNNNTRCFIVYVPDSNDRSRRRLFGIPRTGSLQWTLTL